MKIRKIACTENNFRYRWKALRLVLCKRSGPVQTRPGQGFPRSTGYPGPRVGTVRVPRSTSVRSGPNPCQTRPGQTPTGWHGPDPVRSGPVQSGWSGFQYFVFSFKTVKLFKPDSKLNLEKMATWILMFFISN